MGDRQDGAARTCGPGGRCALGDQGHRGGQRRVTHIDGIGLFLQNMAAHGVKVALFDLNEEKGEALAQELGGVFCNVNVTDDASVDLL